MAEAATKLPIRTEKQAPAPAVGSWAPFDMLRREIDQLFDGFGSRWRPFGSSRAFELEPSWPRGTAWNLAPAVDVAERETEYEITAELPGLDEKDIEVKLANGTLTIRGEKKEEREEKRKDYHLSERRYGSFTRSFSVPEGVDAEKIEAGFSKGVLTVKLPKSAAAQQTKTIAVKAA
jgi:HSP20 family protein